MRYLASDGILDAELEPLPLIDDEDDGEEEDEDEDMLESDDEPTGPLSNTEEVDDEPDEDETITGPKV